MTIPNIVFNTQNKPQRYYYPYIFTIQKAKNLDEQLKTRIHS